MTGDEGLSPELLEILRKAEEAGHLIPNREPGTLKEWLNNKALEWRDIPERGWEESFPFLLLDKGKIRPPEPVVIPDPAKDPMTHVAGDCITLFGRYMRQRCSWCGVILLEYDLARVAVPVGQDPTPAYWPPGSQVFVDNTGTPHVSYVVETEIMENDEPKIADDSCMINIHTMLSFDK